MRSLWEHLEKAVLASLSQERAWELNNYCALREHINKMERSEFIDKLDTALENMFAERQGGA